VLNDDDAMILADPLDLSMLVKNLIDNAVRFSPTGGRVDISLVASAGAVTLLVEDNGPGIAAHERERVFDPFYRVLGSVAPGSGLGLAIVRAVATKIGATISLEDMPAGGLRVRVVFSAG
jgi:two-component system OmpR family sensor kinase